MIDCTEKIHFFLRSTGVIWGTHAFPLRRLLGILPSQIHRIEAHLSSQSAPSSVLELPILSERVCVSVSCPPLFLQDNMTQSISILFPWWHSSITGVIDINFPFPACPILLWTCNFFPSLRPSKVCQNLIVSGFLLIPVALRCTFLDQSKSSSYD